MTVGGTRFPEVAEGVRLLDAAALDSLSADARLRPRGRVNGNVHAMEDRVHRLLNAVEPGSYIRPHRHLLPPKDETLVVVRGALGLVVFGPAGEVAATALLRPGDAFGADVRAGVLHTFVALEPGTVFFEVKEGPYVAPVEGDLAAWAPPEGGEESAPFEARLRALFPDSPGSGSC